MKRILPIIIILACMFLTGCDKKTTVSDGTRVITKPLETTDPRNLQEDVYYIMHTEKDKTVYYPMYMNEGNFSGKTDRVDTNRVLWFSDDYTAIPTFRQGDQIIIKTVGIPNQFIWERFKLNGYTIGFCGAKQSSQSGKYYINTQSGTNICRASSASMLLQLRDEATMLYSIGGIEELGPGNFQEGGALAGLEQNAKYKCVFARGSKRYTTNLIADVIEMTCMEVQATSKFDYIDNDFISIRIPKEFNTGYYSINGQGIFRYLTGDKYDDETNYNIPNDKVSEESGYVETPGDTNYAEEEKVDILEYPMKVETNKPTTIVITYEEYEPNDQIPVVKIISNSYVLTMNKVENENKFEETYQLPMGDYTIQIRGTNNRKFIVTAGAS